MNNDRSSAGVPQNLIEHARTIAELIKQHARAVDEQAVFPEAALAALKRGGFMGALIPQAYGGLGVSFRTMAELAQLFAGACLSTGMIWAMHCQQVAVLIDHAPEPLRQAVLSRIATEGCFVGSVTSERGKGGHLLSAQAPLLWDGDDIVLVREAPVVTGGAYADCYLITMRADESSLPSEVKLVYAERCQLEISQSSHWNALGMRGTHSVGMAFKGRIPPEQVINPTGEFGFIAASTLVPVGHIAWAACWLGAARETFQEMLAVFRNPRTRGQFNLDSDLFAERLAQIRLQLDTVSAYLKQVILEYEELRDNPGENGQRFNGAAYHIHINNLKIIASEMLFEAINQLVKLSGLQYGYLKHQDIVLERTFRDLRSASLMYANDRLLTANGKLALFDQSVTLL